MAHPSIEDRMAINDLFVRYTTALDAGDVETIVGCFTENAALVSPTVGTYTGREHIRAFAERFARFQASGQQLRHAISNLAVSVDGDTARATCYLINMITRHGKSELLAPGRYECDLERGTDGAWRFSRRVVILDQPVQLDGI